MEVEKNEVNIEKLFNWSRVFEIGEEENPIFIYMKVLGDADLNKTRVHALRESAKLRRELRDPNSDQYLVAIRDKEDLSKEDLVNYNVIFSAREITQNVWKNVKVPYPKQPKSDASLEEQERYQKEVDDYPKKKEEEFRKAINESESKLKKELQSKSDDDLYILYKKSVTNELCEQKAISAFKEMSVYLGCYKDDEFKDRFFESFEQLQNLEPAQKVEFLSAYQTLEMGTDEIKKLREATQ